MKAKISALESDNSILQQKEGMSHKLKEKLMEKVSYLLASPIARIHICRSDM